MLSRCILRNIAMTVNKKLILKCASVVCIGVTLTTLMLGCASKHKREVQKAATADSLTYHADNDIAMLIKSMVDAIRVGENLDSLRYTYQSVLTDGQGQPLYTDVEDSPGLWSVKVVSSDNVIISNVYLGDLIPEHLQSYLLESLSLDSTALIKDRPWSELESKLMVYDFKGGYIAFDTGFAKAKNGKEGTLMHIILSAKEDDAVKK